MIRTQLFNNLPIFTGIYDTTKFVVTNSGSDGVLYFSTLYSLLSGISSSGTVGPQGPSGEAGATGAQGPSGDTGPSGASGLDGKTVLNGTGLPSNLSGVDGDFYLRTSTYDFYGPKSGGTWSSYFNLIGPTGATGPSGASGLQGIQGIQGISGLQGASGATGASGAQGPQGIQGISGQNGRTIFNGTGIPSTGLGVDGDFYFRSGTYDFYGPKEGGLWNSFFNMVGPTGATGPSGASGSVGPQGTTGVAGPSGSQGPSGVDGRTIFSGTGIPINGLGLDGDYYFRTTTYDFYGPKDGGTWSSYFNMVGPTGATGPAGPSGATGLQGPTGATGIQGPIGPSGATGATGPQGISGIAGRTILNGTGIPAGGLGVDGDFYLRTTNYDFYGPKDGGSWSTFINIIGPTGATGPQGPSGATGAQGISGAVGAQGPIGPSGATGATGPQGISGDSGKTILNGTGIPSNGLGTNGDFYFRSTTYDFYGPKIAGEWSGYFNMIGPTGATGAQGPIGLTGPTGATGTQGPQGISGLSGINGNTILNGTGIPSNSLGANGDFYIRTTTYDFYGPKITGAWSGYFNLIGPTGATGATGPSGATGAQGPQGIQGISGLSGVNGNTIWNGTGIPSDSLGLNGDFYFRSGTYDFYGPKTTGTWPYYFNMVGPSGATGPQGTSGAVGTSGAAGKTILNGTGIPTAGIGTDGDFYFRSGVYDFYGPKEGGQWSSYFNMVGPTGAQGPIGPSGATGAQGPQGISGAVGATGPQGPTGVIPSGSMGAIYHGATAGTSRITGFDIITWIGSVEPSNAVNNDIWINTA